jgi:hypothetical protein
MNEVIAAVAPHRARLEHLALWAQSSSDLLFIEAPMPLLSDLDLGLELPPAGFVTSCDVPLLRKVSLRQFAAATVILPWAQLTSLTLDGVFPHEGVPILQQASNLVHCKLMVGGRDINQPEPDIRLLCLESLTLENFDDDVAGYLETFIVPVLLDLEISERFLGSNPIASLAFFISKSGCKLQNVRITGMISVRSASYRQAFPSIPNFVFGLG